MILLGKLFIGLLILFIVAVISLVALCLVLHLLSSLHGIFFEK